jgi:predicted RecA/RadA family phage recombinase
MAIPSGYRADMCQTIKCSFEEHKVYTNSTGANILQGAFVVLGNMCGVADLDSLSGEDLSLDVSDKLEILTTNVADASTFDTVEGVVYWDDENKEFTDVKVAGLYEVGFLLAAKDSNDLIRFQMYNTVRSVVATSDILLDPLTLLTANNTVTITLTAGTYTEDVSITDFVFTGTDAAALLAGTLVRTSDTVVTITIATGNTGTDNLITVTGEAQATQSTSAAAVASTV